MLSQSFYHRVFIIEFFQQSFLNTCVIMVFVTLYIGGLLLHAGYHVVGDKMRSGETHKADSFFVIDREAYDITAPPPTP